MTSSSGIIILQGYKAQRLKSAIRRFCAQESNGNCPLEIELYRTKTNAYIVSFPPSAPFELFCELLFKLDTGKDNAKQKAYSYYNDKSKSKLPNRSLLYLDPDHYYAAISPQGNLYHEETNGNPYHLKPTGKQAYYIPLSDVYISNATKVATFSIPKRKPVSQESNHKRLQHNGCLAIFTKKGLPYICLAATMLYSASLSARTQAPVSYIELYILLAALPLPLLCSKLREHYAAAATGIFCIFYALLYIPNYHFSKPIASQEATIEEIRQDSKKWNMLTVRFNDNTTFTLRYGVNRTRMQPGDTCILDIYEGLWGMNVCRALKFHNQQLWAH